MREHSSILPIDETARRRFEALWMDKTPAPIESFLPPADSPLYCGTAEELVLIELEFSWSGASSGGSQPALLERYLQRFPVLNQPEVIRRLACEEHRLRHLHGDRPAFADYISRFPSVFTPTDKPFEAPTLAIDFTPDPESAPLPQLPGYDVLKLVGRGGMGMVLQARHQKLNRLTAIKLPRHGSLTKGEADRFRREARAAAKLQHPNICPIYEVGEHHSRPFIAMGFVQGPALSDWARASRPTARQCAEIVEKVAEAVAYAHEHGVIHRDIKPANVMIDTETGQPILTDFGLAKETTTEQSFVTQEGVTLGTPAYMSPEQALGMADKIGPATDVYSLGAMLYELLCGQPPHTGTVGEILSKLQTQSPEPVRKRVPAVHRDLETICMKALAHEPQHRYPTARAMADDLKRFGAGEAILARREGLAARSVRMLRRHPRQLAVIAVIVALALVISLFFARGSSRTRAAVALRQQIETKLESADWSEQYMSGLDSSVASLAGLDASQATAARARIVQTLDQSIDELLKSPSLNAQVESQVQRQIALLDTRAPERAKDARNRLSRRRGVWDNLVDLAAPFANLQTIASPQQLKVEGAALRFTANPGESRRGLAPLVVGRGCVGNVQLELVLDRRGSRSLLPMLSLAGGGQPLEPSGLPSGYAFHIQGISEGQWRITCASYGRGIRTWTIGAPEEPDGLLRLLVVREGSRLRLHINDLPPMVVQDAFLPFPANDSLFTVYLPDKALIRKIRAARQSLPQTPSPLEQGDLLFASSQFSEALTFYQRQLVDPRAADFAQEARYKQALCLIGLGREEESVPLLQQVFREEGSLWPALAGCELLNLQIDVDAVFSTLCARFPAEQIRPLVPPDYIELLTSVGDVRGTNMLLKVGPDAIEAARRARDMANFLFADANSADIRLARTYALAERDSDALKVLYETISKQPVGRYNFDAVEESGTILRYRNQAAAALDQVNKLLLAPDGQVLPQRARLLVERARALVALKRLDEAERDLLIYQTLSVQNQEPYTTDASAALKLGYLHEEKGDAATAKADWQYATVRQYAQRRGLPNNDIGGGGLNQATLMLISGSFADDLTDSQIQKLMSDIVEVDASHSSGSMAALFKTGAVSLPPNLLRDAWRTPRGKALARHRVFRSLPLGELARQTMALGIYQVLLAGCTNGSLPADQDVAMWEHSLAGCNLIRERKIGKGQLLQLYLAWNGTTNFLGWDGVEQSLDPSFRAGMAYVLGKHYRFTGTGDAEKMFRVVLSDTPADATLHRLADEEIKAMTAAKAETENKLRADR